MTRIWKKKGKTYRKDTHHEGRKTTRNLFRFFPLVTDVVVVRPSTAATTGMCVCASDWGVETRWRRRRDRCGRASRAGIKRARRTPKGCRRPTTVPLPPRRSARATVAAHPLTLRSHNPRHTHPYTHTHTHASNSIVMFGNTTNRNTTRFTNQYNYIMMRW